MGSDFGITKYICYTTVKGSVLHRRHQNVISINKWVFTIDQSELCQVEV